MSSLRWIVLLLRVRWWQSSNTCLAVSSNLPHNLHNEVSARCRFSISALRVEAPALRANMVRISSFLRGFVVMYGATCMILFGSVSSLYSPVVFHTVLSSLACWLRESFINHSFGKANSSSVVTFPSHFPLPQASPMSSFTSSVQGVPVCIASLRICGKIFPCCEL